jgi:hypothetical protein
MLLSASGFHLSVFDTKIKYEQLLVGVNFGFKSRENYQLLDKVTNSETWTFIPTKQGILWEYSR